MDRLMIDHAVGVGLRFAVVGAMLALVAVTAGSVAAQDDEAGSVTFTELNESGINGSAELTADGDRTRVEIRAEGALGDHPTHIHQGTCGDLDPNPKYPLNNVELSTTDLTGQSDTAIDVPLSELLGADHLILIHKSADEIGTYYACGDIVAGRLAAEADAGGQAAAGPLGNTGSGPVAAGRAVSLLAGLAMLAVVLAIAIAGPARGRGERRA
jgi:hypothetical protein